MKKARKIAAFLIAAAMSLCVLPSSVIAEETGTGVVSEINGEEGGDVISEASGDETEETGDDETEETGDDVTSEAGDGETTEGTGEEESEEEEGSEDYGIAPMSLLPMTEVEDTINIDREATIISGEKPYYTVKVSELLSDKFSAERLLSEGKYTGDLVYSIDNTDDYVMTNWDDEIKIYSKTAVVYFIASKDQLNPSKNLYKINVNIKSYESQEAAEILIDRTGGIPESLSGAPEYSYYVKEALADILKYDIDSSGKILYSDTYVDRPINFDDILTIKSTNLYLNYEYINDFENDIHEFCKTAEDNISLIVEKSGKKILYNIKVKLVYSIFSPELTVYSPDNVKLAVAGGQYYTTSNTEYVSISDEKLKSTDQIGISISLPSGYSSSDVSVYEGEYKTVSDIPESKNITSKVIGSQPYKIGTVRSFCLTYVISGKNGKYAVPIYYQIYATINNVYLTAKSKSSYYSSTYLYASERSRYNNELCYTVYGNNYSDVELYIRASYNDFINPKPNGADSIKAACIGTYKSESEMPKDKEIKSQIFVDYTELGLKIDLSACRDTVIYNRDKEPVNVKAFDLTSVDVYNTVHNSTIYFKLVKDEEPVITSTSFSVTGASKESGNEKDVYNSYKVAENNDDSSFYGYQTIFILDGEDPVADETTIYPIFETQDGIRVRRRDDTEIQESGKSAITFKSGDPIMYYAVSSRERNYWVTFVTQQTGGSKLFVNGTNVEEHKNTETGNPKREIFLTGAGSGHDILFANIGDAELRNISVELIDANGIELDPYWTVLGDGKKSLAPFKKSGNAMESVAKVRIVPTEDASDELRLVSGKLVISSNGGSETIELTGIAGTPKIITTQDEIYDGVKYVPYSCFILTNNKLNEQVSMEFSYSGVLPRGLKLDKTTGEIYGIPQETGEFPITVTAKYIGKFELDNPDYVSTADYVITVKENTDENVKAVNTDRQGEDLTKEVSREITVYYSGIDSEGYPETISRIEMDSDIFESQGNFDDFMGFYLDGEDVPLNGFNAERGSTIITVLEQTFSVIPISSNTTPHTLAAEFREGHDKTKKLTRSAQNVYLNFVNVPNGSSGNENGNSVNASHNAVGMKPEIIKNKTSAASRSVNAVMSFVDGNGKPLSGVALELHSDPMTALTDASGAAAFDNIEFGKHTLYIKDSSGKTLAEKKFSIASGKSVKIKNDVITAVAGEPLYLSVQFDGSEITFLTAGGEDVSVAAGIDADSEIIEVNFSNNRYFVFIIIPIIAVSAALILFAKKRNN